MPGVDLLVEQPLLQVAIVVALGALVGQIPFGPLRFGAAGALFVGLAVGAVDPRLGEGLGLAQSLGLALFVYCVGLTAGQPFLEALRTAAPVMLLACVALVGVAGLALGIAALTGVSPAFMAGVFAGAGNSTPTLQAALDAAGTSEPSVGYALAYPVGVAVTIALIASVLRRPFPGSKDPAPAAAAGIATRTVTVTSPCAVAEVPVVAQRRVLLTMLYRDGHTHVLSNVPELREGDEVLVVGPAAALAEATDWLGEPSDHDLVDDRTEVTYRRVLVSRSELAGRTIADLELEPRFGAVASRVRRGDLDMLAHPDMRVRVGDRIRVVAPRGQLDAVSEHLGDSEREVNALDLLTLGTGLALGILVGLPGLVLGDVRLSLGAAAGPLIVGMVLGLVRSTGPLVWELPLAANQLLRQLGVAVFLACVGLAAGKEFADTVLSTAGLVAVVSSAVLMGLGGLAVVWVALRVGASAPRAAGLLAGYNGQPAALAYANEQVFDERVDAGYSTLFALTTVVKIVLAQLIVVFGALVV
jgi:putative transport protein